MPPVDLSKLSDEDLDALEKRDLTKLSDEGLAYLENSSKPFVGPPELGPRDSVVAADGASDEEKKFVADYHAISDKAKNDPSVLSRLYNRMKATGMDDLMQNTAGPGGVPFSPGEIDAREKSLGEDNRLSPFAAALPAAPVVSAVKGAASSFVGKASQSEAEHAAVMEMLKTIPPAKAREVVAAGLKALKNPKALLEGTTVGALASHYLPVKQVAGATAAVGAAGGTAALATAIGVPETILTHMIYERIAKDPQLSKAFGIKR